jgi:hypothetical protein
MAGALAPRVLATIVVPGDHEQGDKARFEIRGEEGCHRSNSLKIEMAG